MNCRFIVHIILKKRNLSSGLFKNAVNSLINWYTEVASEEKHALNLENRCLITRITRTRGA
ncbi:hypothetical protein ATS04_03455 [Salmonella enterica]|nr:hypothetical protein [Salmonella enterica]